MFRCLGTASNGSRSLAAVPPPMIYLYHSLYDKDNRLFVLSNTGESVNIAYVGAFCCANHRRSSSKRTRACRCK